MELEAPEVPGGDGLFSNNFVVRNSCRVERCWTSWSVGMHQRGFLRSIGRRRCLDCGLWDASREKFRLVFVSNLFSGTRETTHFTSRSLLEFPTLPVQYSGLGFVA